MLSPGIVWGLLGVGAFSFTVPFTRVAVQGLDPVVIGCGRAVVAAVLAAAALMFGRACVPTTGQWLRLCTVSVGVVVGFPMCTTLALRDVGAGHSAVLIGLLPAATSVVAVMIGGERPARRFWFGAALGVIATATFSVVGHGAPGAPTTSDLFLLAAVALAAFGYAQGGLLARELGSWQTICWALLLALPVTAPVTVVATGGHLPHAVAGQWAAFGYLSAVSMFLGFFAWYRGLAIGPITTVSQIQLVQPVLSVGWAVLFLGEHLSGELVVGGLAVIGCAAFTVRSRVVHSRPPGHSTRDSSIHSASSMSSPSAEMSR